MLKMIALLFALFLSPLAGKGSLGEWMPQQTDSMFHQVHFLSGGLQLEGRLFLPLESVMEKFPVIVMAPGFSGTMDCNYQFIAERFAREGFAVLLFDYPNFGKSEMRIKGEADPWQQVQAYRDAISFLETREEIDRNRIGVWGGSYSGGHSIVVCAMDRRVKCMVALTPFISGSYYFNNSTSETKYFLSQQFNADRMARLKGDTSVRIPVATNDERQFAAILGQSAWEFIQSFKDYAPDFSNQVTLKSLEMQLEYEPGYYAPQIGTIPKLFIIATRDEFIPESLILNTFHQAAQPKELVYIEGRHFSPYLEKLPESSQLAISWFKKHL